MKTNAIVRYKKKIIINFMVHLVLKKSMKKIFQKCCLFIFLNYRGL